jgi:hypothetical protein
MVRATHFYGGWPVLQRITVSAGFTKAVKSPKASDRESLSRPLDADLVIGGRHVGAGSLPPG